MKWLFIIIIYNDILVDVYVILGLGACDCLIRPSRILCAAGTKFYNAGWNVRPIHLGFRPLYCQSVTRSYTILRTLRKSFCAVAYNDNSSLYSCYCHVGLAGVKLTIMKMKRRSPPVPCYTVTYIDAFVTCIHYRNLRCSDVAKFSIYGHQVYTPPCCRSSCVQSVK